MTGDHTARSRPLRPGDPRHLGRYEMIGRLGEGGMGTVYLAQTPEGQHVAVKMIRSDLADDADFRRRFRREVQRARQVPPFCTAEVLDADPEHDQPYLVVEYVDGPSLAAVVAQRGPLTQANLHGLAIGVATALTAIHGAGVVHRDLKPGNVLLAPGSPKVIDFGIARAVPGGAGANWIDAHGDSTHADTQAGQVIGTLAYLAPERFAAASDVQLSPAVDIFAWGGVITYAGTGRAPFPAESPQLMAARILTQPPDLTGLAEPLRELVTRALAKNPAQRPTARELLDWLLTAGPYHSRELAAALARQPALLVAAEGAQAATDQHPFPQLGSSRPPLPRQPSHPGSPGSSGSPGSPGETEPPGETELPTGAESSAGGPPPAKRRWRRGTFLAMLAILAVVGAAAGVAYGLAPQLGSPPAAGAHFALPRGAQRVVKESLATEATWRTGEEAAFQAKCAIEGALVVTKGTPGPYRCAGARDTLTNFVTQVDVTIGTKGSCAAIWYRFDRAGYALRICSEGYHLVTHGAASPAAVVELHAFPFAGAVALRTAMRVSIVAYGTSMRFYRDGTEIGAWTDGTFRAGRVLLGIFVDSVDDPPPYQVSYANVEMYRLPD